MGLQTSHLSLFTFHDLCSVRLRSLTPAKENVLAVIGRDDS
jgi:hypothetical protein